MKNINVSTNYRSTASRAARITRRTGARVSSPSSGVHPGARALNLELPTSFGISLVVGVLGLLFGGLFSSVFLPHSAYAASYLNVSSGGAVSLGSIRPTSSGTSSTGSDTLTVHTDCSAGYSVYVSGQNGKDTNLTNSSAESNNTISTSSNAIGSAGSLSSNTWGLNSENTGAYVGLPTYANATNKALTTKTSVAESSTVPIYYGIKVDTSVTPGTYTGDVLYTVLPNSACTTYTVRFNANGGSGTMNNQTITVGKATNLTMNAFTRSGYMFLGWATSPSATTPTYKDGESVTDITTFNTTIDLYAVWGQITGDMQTFQCSTLSAGQTVYLKDLRDDSVYTVKKYTSDGNCWMASNLVLGYDKGYALTNELTNIQDIDTATYYIPKAGHQGDGEITDDSRNSTTTSDWTSDSASDRHAKVQYHATGITSKGYVLPQGTGYYNFYTATLGCSYYGDGLKSGECASGYIARDICPKGWLLPAGSNTAKSWVALDKELNGPSAGTNRNDATARDIFLNTADFFYSGVYVSKNSLSNLGVDGHWWASTNYNTNLSYALYVSSDKRVYPLDYNAYKIRGNAVRCVAQDNYTVNYSTDGAESGTPSKTSEGTVYENGSVTMPTVGTMAKSGYEFKGWALTSGATEAAYTAEETVALSALLTATSSAGQTTAPGSTITLYPVWEQSPATMQDWSVNNGCASLSAGETVALVDKRDGSQYRVKKFVDGGNCWMIDNLVLGYDKGYALTSADTNITGSSTYYIPKAGYQGTGEITDDSRNSTTPATWTADPNNDKHAKAKYVAAGSTGELAQQNTTYYNFYTATLGFASYKDDNFDQGSSIQDICPKGFQMPTSHTTDKSWEHLYNELGSDFDKMISDADFYDGSWWSSSLYELDIDGGYRSYGLFIGTKYKDLDYYYDASRYLGLAVRCVASIDGMMQEVSASDLTESATTTLVDARDNQTYTVYRWPSTGTAGTDYPTGMAGYAIMTKDLSLGYVTGGSITKGKDLTLTTADSASSGTITARTGMGDWSIDDADSNLQYINGPQSGKEAYSSHSYYSYGAALVVCPKGWFLPGEGHYSRIKAFMGSNTQTGLKKMVSEPYNFAYGGTFDSGGWSSVGNGGLYWSSTRDNSRLSYAMLISSSYFGTTEGNANNLGQSVRCIASP